MSASRVISVFDDDDDDDDPVESESRNFLSASQLSASRVISVFDDDDDDDPVESESRNFL